MEYWKPAGYWMSRLSWQFLRFSVTATLGPIDATKLSKIRVTVVWSSEMRVETVPCGQPVPPYPTSWIVTVPGSGASLVGRAVAGEATSARASPRTVVSCMAAMKVLDAFFSRRDATVDLASDDDAKRERRGKTTAFLYPKTANVRS